MGTKICARLLITSLAWSTSREPASKQVIAAEERNVPDHQCVGPEPQAGATMIFANWFDWQDGRGFPTEWNFHWPGWKRYRFARSSLRIYPRGVFVMRMPFLPIALGSLLLAGEVLLGLNACGGGTPGITNPPPPGKIQYVVVIFQENRTPDNLFHDSVLISRGADIASSGINSNHQTMPLSPISLANQYDLAATHSS